MEIRKVTSNFIVTGTRCYKDEIVIFTDKIVILSTEDNSADDMIMNSERVAKIREHSEIIRIT